MTVMNLDGTMNAACRPFEGMTIARGAQVGGGRSTEGGWRRSSKIDPHSHAVGHCERCGTVVEPLISKQWFLKWDRWPKPAIEAAYTGDVTFVPDRFKGVYLNWMENVHDWCISRQLWWGHRIPVWYCQRAVGDRDDRGDDPRVPGMRWTCRARSRRARHLVHLRAVAIFNDGLAGSDSGSCPLLPVLGDGNGLRDSLFLGRQDGLLRHRDDGRSLPSTPSICMARCVMPKAPR